MCKAQLVSKMNRAGAGVRGLRGGKRLRVFVLGKRSGVGRNGAVSSELVQLISNTTRKSDAARSRSARESRNGIAKRADASAPRAPIGT